MIRETASPGDAAIVHEGSVADVFVGESEADVVEIAATDLAADVERVTGVRPDLVETPADTDGTAVVVGTAGGSDLVDRCLSRVDGAAATFADGETLDGRPLADRRESSVVATVADPPDLVAAEDCLVVAGSDRRGTAYGCYELSERMGVSPWYWWADVSPEERDSVVVAEGAHAFGPPDVTYRGIFLNDEDFGLRPWASETFAPEDAEDRPGIGPKTYERIFELLLRLKANAIWPAMHPNTKAFYRYPEHAELADRYAIVVGTSHCEPMHRNNVDEWEDDPEEWNYATNDERIREYWRERVESVADYENVFTIGMRGIHDSGMPGAESVDERVDLLQDVLDDQREMLDDAHDRPVDEVPQMLCPYKEVLELLRGGLDVPEDVCLVWPNDSHGYVRDLPTAAERERSGGSGVYYHLSYWGRPHDYLWLSSVPPALVRHQMLTAYEAGARECWVVNVGDVKPTEKETEFFLDLAWDVDGAAAGPIREWLGGWARREFGDAAPVAVATDDEGTDLDADDLAAEVADILTEYYRLCQARKPEHMGWSEVYPDTEPDDPEYSAVSAGDEARRRVEDFEAIASRAEAVHDALPDRHRPAFYELVVHPVRCAALMTAKYLHASRSRLYAGQGRVTADAYAERAREAHEAIRAETDYYNEELLDGKWDGMQSASPRDLPVFGEPATAGVDPHDGAALGVVPEGHRRPVGPHEERPPALPTFDPATDGEHFVDVFARGTDPAEWSVETSEDWIEVDQSGGTVADERRLWVGVDWAATPPSDEADDRTLRGEVTVSDGGVEKAVAVRAVPAAGPDGDFVEANGSVAIEAEHFSRREDAGERRWERTDIPGRVSGETVAVRPRVFDGVDSVADAPRLTYDVALRSAGDLTVEVHCVPTQSITEDHDLRYAVAFGDEEPTVRSVDVDGGEHDPEWQRNVLRGAALGTTAHSLDAGADGASDSGTVTLSVWALDPGLVVDRIVIRTGDDRATRSPTYLGPRETAVDR